MITDDMLNKDRLLREKMFDNANNHQIQALEKRIETMEYTLSRWMRRDEATLFDFERIEIAGIRAEVHRLKTKLNSLKPEDKSETKDLASVSGMVTTDSAAADNTSENYGIFDASPQQPGEIIVSIPLGKLGLAEIFFNPLTRTSRPIPKI